MQKENIRLKGDLSVAQEMRGARGICLEIDGKDMTDVYALQQEINEKDAVIKFLKKELQHKTSYRQVMKKQYRELKQKYDALLSKRNPVDTRFANFVKTMEEDKR